VNENNTALSFLRLQRQPFHNKFQDNTKIMGLATKNGGTSPTELLLTHFLFLSQVIKSLRK
jgi:hypothetical protein